MPSIEQTENIISRQHKFFFKQFDLSHLFFLTGSSLLFFGFCLLAGSPIARTEPRDWNKAKQKNKQICCFVCFQCVCLVYTLSYMYITWKRGHNVCVSIFTTTTHWVLVYGTITLKCNNSPSNEVQKRKKKTKHQQQKLNQKKNTQPTNQHPNQTVHFPKYLNYFLEKVL